MTGWDAFLGRPPSFSPARSPRSPRSPRSARSTSNSPKFRGAVACPPLRSFGPIGPECFPPPWRGAAVLALPLFAAEARARQGMRTDLRANWPEGSEGRARERAARAVEGGAAAVFHKVQNYPSQDLPAHHAATRRGRIA